jgi:hypothetical protein
LHLDDEDRRWFVPRVTEKTQPLEYWQVLYAWLRDGGLRIIKQWAIDFLRETRPVAVGERAPASSAKQEVIFNSRSPGQRLVFDFVDYVKERLAKGEGPFVFSVHEIHEWVAAKRRIEPTNKIMESALTIRTALRSAGLYEPEQVDGERAPRFRVNGHLTHIVSTQPLGVVSSWPDHKVFHKKPDEIEPY